VLDVNKFYMGRLSMLCMPRPDKDKYYLSIAMEVARRGTCMRRQFGAIIVNNDQIVSTGYCGAPRGTPNCNDLGKCYREEQGIPPGQNYELCRSVHAEMNAVIHAARQDIAGGTIYIAGREAKEPNEAIEAYPCKMCRRVILNAGITRVVIATKDGMRAEYPEDWIREAHANPFAELEKEGY